MKAKKFNIDLDAGNHRAHLPALAFNQQAAHWLFWLLAVYGLGFWIYSGSIFRALILCLFWGIPYSFVVAGVRWFVLMRSDDS